MQMHREVRHWRYCFVPALSFLDNFFQISDLFVVICFPYDFPHVELFRDNLDVGIHFLHQKLGEF